jgi:hypothetical protein
MAGCEKILFCLNAKIFLVMAKVNEILAVLVLTSTTIRKVDNLFGQWKEIL